MDELIAQTGLGKATVYRLWPTKDALIGAYLTRLSSSILELVDRDITQAAGRPHQALHQILGAISADVSRPEFRGCPFNNASIEFADRSHPARRAARSYRTELAERLTALSQQLLGDEAAGDRLGKELAGLIDGAYTSAAHLGPDGPSQTVLELAHSLVEQARARTTRP